MLNKMMCPHCGLKILCDKDGLIPYHDYPNQLVRCVPARSRTLVARNQMPDHCGTGNQIPTLEVDTMNYETLNGGRK